MAVIGQVLLVAGAVLSIGGLIAVCIGSFPQLRLNSRVSGAAVALSSLCYLAAGMALTGIVSFRGSTLTFSGSEPVGVMVHGGKAEPLLMPVSPRIVADRAFVPLQFLDEALGYRAIANESGDEATVYRGARAITFWAGRDLAEVNGRKTRLDAIPFAADGTIQIPLRFVVESMGGQIAWSDSDSRVLILP